MEESDQTVIHFEHMQKTETGGKSGNMEPEAFRRGMKRLKDEGKIFCYRAN
jgi:hypothetical protein